MAVASLVEPEIVVAETLLEWLRLADIRVPRLAEVRDYLKRFPDVVPAVRHIGDLAVAEFADKAELSLEIYVDPEIDDPHLRLYVRQEPFDSATWPQFERIQEACADALAETEGWLHVGPDWRAADRR
jgi:hypothetical protein